MIHRDCIARSPFPHVLVAGLFPAAVYWRAQEAWPALIAGHGRVGRDLMPGDEGYAEAVSSAAWQPVLDALHGAIAEQLLMAFADLLPIPLPLIQIKPFEEPRAEVHLRDLPPPRRRDPGELFVRVDFQEGATGYEKPRHLDWRRRVISGIVFLSDAHEAKMQGGSLALYDGHRVALRVRPKHNVAVFWLGNNESYHAGERITATERPRRWLYFAISSTHSVW